MASPSFDVSDFEEHRWYLNANFSAGASSSRPESSVGAGRSFSLVSDNPGPSFATVSGAVLSSGQFDVPSAVAAAHRGLPVQGMKFFLGRWLLAADFWTFRAFGEYVWFSLQETRGTARGFGHSTSQGGQIFRSGAWGCTWFFLECGPGS